MASRLQLGSAVCLAAILTAMPGGAVGPAAADPQILHCPTLPAPLGAAGRVPRPARSFADSVRRGATAPAPVELFSGAPLPVSAMDAAFPIEEILPVAPLGFMATSFVVDPPRDRLVTYGGDDGMGAKFFSVLVRPLSGVGTWSVLRPAGPTPVGQMDQATVYDPVRDRLIVYGGWSYDSYAASAVWALSLSGDPVWTELVPPGTGPGYRVGAQAAYDPVGDRMIVFGGHAVDGAATQTDLWSLNLSGAPAWTQLAPGGTPPPPRADAGMVYDPVRHRMVLFGGCPGAYGTGAWSDVWALSLGDSLAWQELFPGGEAVPGLHSFASVYDPVRDRLLVFSGRDSNPEDPPRPETWALEFHDSLAWGRIAPAGPQPAARYFSRATYDPSRDRVLLYGGSAGSDLWALAFAPSPAWTRLEAADAGPPQGRYLATAVYDPARHRTLVYGGEWVYEAELDWFYTALGDLWSLPSGTLARWQPVARDSAPPGRHGHTAIVDPVGDRMIVFGGGSYPGGVIDGDVWQLPLEDGQPWSRLATTGEPPIARTLHSAIYDPVGRRMIVYGGMNGTTFDDAWALSLDGQPTWAPLDVGAIRPSARWGHGAVYDPIGRRMIVFGGQAGPALSAVTWQLSLTGAPAWSLLPSALSPPARRMPVMVCDPLHRRVVLFGGEDGNGVALKDAWVLSLTDTSGWQPATTAGLALVPRWGAAATYEPDSDVVLVYGGAVIPCGDGQNNAWAMFSAVPVELPAAARVEAHPWHVVVTWQTSAGKALVSVERRTPSTDWVSVASVQADAGGRVRFEDTDAQPGGRYAYRLEWTQGRTILRTTEVWVDVAALHFALVGATPNPSPSGLAVALSLPDAVPATLDVVDVAGRRVFRSDVGALGAGDHVVTIAPANALPPGVYLVRLVRDGVSLVARASVLR